MRHSKDAVSHSATALRLAHARQPCSVDGSTPTGVSRHRDGVSSEFGKSIGHRALHINDNQTTGDLGRRYRKPSPLAIGHGVLIWRGVASRSHRCVLDGKFSRLVSAERRRKRKLGPNVRRPQKRAAPVSRAARHFQVTLLPKMCQLVQDQSDLRV